MKALIAFIVMALCILALIEINERIKAKKKNQGSEVPKKDCNDSCSDCSLMDVCDKKSTAAQ
ncbi:MAG: hypothetical protein J6T80_04675 [Paludibacteraceae bacterium]|nr:hypothetical protein [Paludibacteraceae bacterium]